MPEREGYKTIDEVAKQLHLTEEEVRTAIKILRINPHFFVDDRRSRYYTPENVEDIRKLFAGK